MHVINPTTGDVLEHLESHTPAEVEALLTRSAAAAERWSATALDVRVDALHRLAALFDRDKEPLARQMCLEMGKPIGEAIAEVEKCAGACRYYADNGPKFLAQEPVETDARRSWVQFDPLGVLLAVMPWNFPYWQVVRAAAPALMAGNVVILKHASNVPGCARLLTALFGEAGFGPGAFENLVADRDEVGEVIGDDRIAAVTLTGSVGAGRSVAALAGAALKPSVLELGGSDAFVVLPDADVDAAVAGAMSGRFLNAGQSCISAKRMIVCAPVYDAFVEGLEKAIVALQVGDPLDASTQIGPMARADLRDTVHDQVTRSIAAGACCRVGGNMMAGAGAFYTPTLLTEVEPGMAAFDEEVFGPVAAVIRAEDPESALALANGTRFGLGASVWTSDVETGLAWTRALVSGHVSVNGIVKSDSRLPFGGVRESGYGRELSRVGMLAFVNQKSVWMDL